MNLEVQIQADVNDADYINENTPIEESEIVLIKKVSEIISESEERCNWESPRRDYVNSGKLTEEEFDRFNEYVPWMDNQEVHTIESITIVKTEVVENLL